jgi:hypothetical protein
MGSMVALLVVHFTVAGRRNPDKKIKFSFQTFGFSFSIWLGQLFLGTAYPLIYVFELKLEEFRRQKCDSGRLQIYTCPACGDFDRDVLMFFRILQGRFGEHKHSGWICSSLRAKMRRV